MKTLLAVITCTLVLMTGCATTVTAIKKGPIHEHEGDRTWGAWVDDQRIETVTSVNLAKASPELKRSHIVPVSFNSYVLLVGQVSTQKLKTKAEAVAKDTLKVRKVFNELEVSGPTTALVRSNDAWLTAKIKSRMVATEGFPSSRVKVITENGTVYLMGLVTRKEAERATALTQKSYGIQKIVKVFEYIQ